MKWILFLSVILNVILAISFFQKKEVVKEEIVEKIVVQHSDPQVIEKKVIVKVPGEAPETSSAPRDFDEKEMEDVVVDVNKDREDFLVGKLGFSEKNFKEIEAVKQSFYEQYQKILPQDHVGNLTLQQRRAMLELEEKRDAQYARVLGQKKWNEWESFRDGYNKKMFKKMIKEKGVIVPMEI